MNRKVNRIELIIIYISSFILLNFINTFTIDEVWNFGFCYNILNCLIPYREFNMVISPLYSYIGSIFLGLFGSNIVVFNMYNALLCTLIFYMLKKLYGKYAYILNIVLYFKILPNYNILCLLLLLIVIYLERKKKSSLGIGIILGILFLTKQNIGIYMLIPSLFIKDGKIIKKRIFGFLIPIFVFIIYLLYNQNLFEFIDYAFLGMGSFALSNFNVFNILYIIIFIFIILYCIYKYYKLRDIEYLYCLFFQLMMYPIFDMSHLSISIIPFIGIFLNNYKIKITNYQCKIFMVCFFITLFIIYIVCICRGSSIINMDSKLFKYRGIKSPINLQMIINYVRDRDVIILDDGAYLIKLESGKKIDKYDLINNGNMGYKGDIKIINELDNRCNNKQCKFIIDRYEFFSKYSQTNRNIYDYIINNYIYEESIDNFDIYTNEISP